MFTTFNLVAFGENTLLIQRLEEMTGSQFAYGLNTPINFVDIRSNLGLETASVLLAYADGGSVEASKSIALDWITANLGLWNALFPNDNRLLDLVYYCQQYQINSGPTSIPRVDYCGDPIPGADANSFLAGINDIVSALTSVLQSIDPFDYTPPTFELYFRVFDYINGISGLNADPDFIFVQSGIGSPDPVRSRLADYPGYQTQSVADLEANDLLVQQTGFTFDPNNSIYIARAVYRSSSPGQDFFKLAQQEFIEAVLIMASLLSDQTQTGIPDIFRALSNAASYFARHNQTIQEPLLNRIRQIALDGNTPPITEVPEYADVMNQILEAELNTRAALLRDPVFVNDYGDTDLSGFLTKSERIALETEVNLRRVTARRDKARELYDTYNAEYLVWNSYGPTSLDSIFDVHVV